MPQTTITQPASSSLTSEDDPSGSTEIGKEKPTSKRKCFTLKFFSGHTVAEAGHSAWFDTRALLIFRLFVSAFLVSHIVFFSLTKDISFRLYASWSFAGFTVAFVLVVMCSLIEVLRMGDDDEEGSEPRDEEEGAVRAASIPTSDHARDTGLIYVLAQVAVPMYQLFVTAVLFSTIVYWAAIHSSQGNSISYSLLAVNVVAPAVALLDMFLSMSMRFRFVYVPLFVLYNGAYAGALYAFFRLEDLYVYQFIDPSIQEQGAFIGKVSALAVASVMAALVLCGISIARDLSFVRRRREKIHSGKSTDLDESEPKESPTISDRTSGSFHVENKTAEIEPMDEGLGVDKGEKIKDRPEMDELYGGLMVADEVQLYRSDSHEKRDRLSIPLSTRGSSINGPASSRRRQRLSANGRLSASQSVSSAEGREGFARSDSRNSAWDLELDAVQARSEDEYFMMPAVYTADGEAEVVKLAPIARSSSASGDRAFGHRLSRTSSVGNGIRRSNAGSNGRESGRVRGSW